MATNFDETSHSFLTSSFVASVIPIMYTITSSSIQYYYYANHNARGSVNDWKCQPKHTKSLSHADKWWHPLARKKPRAFRAPDHHIICTWNLMVASAFSFSVAEAYQRNLTLWYPSPLEKPNLLFFVNVALMAFLDIAVHQFVVYYWHRLMHTKFFFKRWHKMHHYYKRPEVFDDLYIHPMESALYYVLLYWIPLLIPQYVGSFLLYMAFIGVTGVLDHCGVLVVFPVGIYDTKAHDLHHEYCEVNYGFPFTVMDRLHGTLYHPPEQEKLLQAGGPKSASFLSSSAREACPPFKAG